MPALAAALDAYLSPAQVAARLGVDPETVRREVARGHLRAVRVGRVVRVPASALEEYLCPAPDDFGARTPKKPLTPRTSCPMFSSPGQGGPAEEHRR